VQGDSDRLLGASLADDDPRYIGEVAIIRYRIRKGLEGGRLAEYEHYFEKPGDHPAYPEIYEIGRGQYWMPPGDFRVSAEGIKYERDRK
jgi:hypothetical protein